MTAEAPLTQAEFLGAVAAAIGVPPPRRRIPYHALYAAACVAERVPISEFTWVRPPLTRLGVAFLGTDAVLLPGEGQSAAALRTTGSAARRHPARGRGRVRSRHRVGHPGHPGCGFVTTLAGEVAIVTGVSSGIGAATARALAWEGARVVLAARRCERLRAEEQAIVAEGGKAVWIPSDVSNRADLTRLVRETEATFGHPDILVNNAGTFWSCAVADTEPDEFEAVLDVNLLGAMLLTREVLPSMLARRHGAIIFIGSLSGRVATEPVYSRVEVRTPWVRARAAPPARRHGRLGVARLARQHPHRDDEPRRRAAPGATHRRRRRVQVGSPSTARGDPAPSPPRVGLAGADHAVTRRRRPSPSPLVTR